MTKTHQWKVQTKGPMTFWPACCRRRQKGKDFSKRKDLERCLEEEIEKTTPAASTSGVSPLKRMRKKGSSHLTLIACCRCIVLLVILPKLCLIMALSDLDILFAILHRWYPKLPTHRQKNLGAQLPVPTPTVASSATKPESEAWLASSIDFWFQMISWKWREWFDKLSGWLYFFGGRVMVFPIQEKVERAPPPTTVHTERFEDLAANSFKVTIAKVQQTALSKAGGRLPTPAEQLAMITKRRTAKKGRTSNAKPSSTLGSNSCICYDQCLIGFIPWLVFWSFEQNELSKDIWHLAPDYRAGRMDSWDPKAY